MSFLFKYLEYCHKSDSLDDFNLKTYDFLNINYGKTEVCLALNSPDLNGFTLLRSNFNASKKEISERLNKLKFKKRNLSGEDSKYFYFFSGANFDTEKIVLFLVRKNTGEEIPSILECWQKNYNLLFATNTHTKEMACNDYNNLISQLLHDVNSLTDLNKNSELDEYINRCNYQKQVNKNLLFYLRDFDLFKNEISLNKLMNDSLSLLELDKLPSISIDTPHSKISLDIELFSTAFNEIVKNAIEAVDNNISKVFIKVYKEISSSPLIKNEWLVFEILDYGKGIAKDFVPFVNNPFFTTNKIDGHSGFGLANAEKIIRAHNGFLHIDSKEKKTSIKIYLPDQQL